MQRLRRRRRPGVPVALRRVRHGQLDAARDRQPMQRLRQRWRQQSQLHGHHDHERRRHQHHPTRRHHPSRRHHPWRRHPGNWHPWNWHPWRWHPGKWHPGNWHPGNWHPGRWRRQPHRHVRHRVDEPACRGALSTTVLHRLTRASPTHNTARRAPASAGALSRNRSFIFNFLDLGGRGAEDAQTLSQHPTTASPRYAERWSELRSRLEPVGCGSALHRRVAHPGTQVARGARFRSGPCRGTQRTDLAGNHPSSSGMSQETRREPGRTKVTRTRVRRTRSRASTRNLSRSGSWISPSCAVDTCNSTVPSGTHRPPRRKSRRRGRTSRPRLRGRPAW